MKLNTRKPFRIGAVLLALTMLASYVVYSQRQVVQTIAPGSKSLILDPSAIQTQVLDTNRPRRSPIVASSSKSMVPIVTIPTTNSSEPVRAITNAPNPMLFPGSKSAPVFHPADVSVLMPRPVPDTHSYSLPAPLPRPTESPKYPTISTVTNTAASFKP